MSEHKYFHDLLFEISNEYRYRILLLIQNKAMRITDLTKELSLTYPEIRRHISRLIETGLIKRDLEGYYHLTPYGETSLLLFQELIFLSTNREYFLTHTLSTIPTGFTKRIGELRASMILASPMDFFRYTENLIKESKEYVWLLVDQFPMNSLSTIVETIDRGVKLRIIEPMERILNPDLEALTSEETQALIRTRQTPLLEQRMIDEATVYMFASEKRCLIAFPTVDGQYDFKGFMASTDSSIKWCSELFLSYWNNAELRTFQASIAEVERRRVSRIKEPRDRIVIEGLDDPTIDAQTVQDAVDNYDEVVLKGTFNFSSSMVQISKSVKIIGEGRENNVPKTIIYKKGWVFPFREWDYVFLVSGEGVDVSIENLYFTDFNGTCLGGRLGNSLSIKNNRIIIPTGFGRGMTYGAFGDLVHGIQIEAAHSFKGGVIVENNYLDYAPGAIWGGHVSRGGLEEDPEYRPDLFNHEYYFGYGIVVNSISGKARIENNVVRNINGRGIVTEGHLASATVEIKHNTVISDVYGSYPFSSSEAGSGILAQSVLSTSGPGFYVEIKDNTIKMDKLNYSGIVILGPATDREGAEKLRGGIIRNNHIMLKDGYEGIHIRKCDDFEVVNNTISGNAYYGIRISGRRKTKERDFRALNNLVEANDLTELNVKVPDLYSNNHMDGRMFSASREFTAHIWLNEYTSNNEINVKENETVIDEGTENKIH